MFYDVKNCRDIEHDLGGIIFANKIIYRESKFNHGEERNATDLISSITFVILKLIRRVTG